MPVKRTLRVLRSAGPKHEAGAIRRMLASPDFDLRIGLAAAHVPGQALRGDAVVFGAASAAIEADVTGQVYYVDDLDDLERLAPKLLGREPAPASGGASEPVPEPEPEPESATVAGDDEVTADTLPSQYHGDDDGEAPGDDFDDLDSIDAEMRTVAEMCGVELPDGRVTNEGLRDIVEACGVELPSGYVKNADLIATIRRETQG